MNDKAKRAAEIMRKENQLTKEDWGEETEEFKGLTRKYISKFNSKNLKSLMQD